MPAFLMSAAAITLYQKMMIFASISLLLLVLGPILSLVIPGFNVNGMAWSWNILEPMTNILAMAPQPVRWFIWYSHADTALVASTTALVYGFIKNVYLAAA
jgi:hypothetical protein